MSREAHVQFCESLGVRFPGATHHMDYSNGIVNNEANNMASLKRL